jgi:hypothetical protein
MPCTYDPNTAAARLGGSTTLDEERDEEECPDCGLPLAECACDELEDRSESMWSDPDFLRDLRNEGE